MVRKLKPIKNKKVHFPIAARQDGKSTLRLNKINKEIKMCNHFKDDDFGFFQGVKNVLIALIIVGIIAFCVYLKVAK